MARRVTQQGGKQSGAEVLAGITAILVMSLGGCAGDPPKPAPTVTPDQVRSHADKAFEKLKQEEQNRATDSPVR